MVGSQLSALWAFEQVRCLKEPTELSQREAMLLDRSIKVWDDFSHKKRGLQHTLDKPLLVWLCVVWNVFGTVNFYFFCVKYYPQKIEYLAFVQLWLLELNPESQTA